MFNRRNMLMSTSCGFGYLALTDMLNASQNNNLAKAKRIIFMYMNGGPSHVDTFDYKPELEKKNGEQDPKEKNRKLHKSISKFSPCGKSGLMISDLFPQLQKHADDLCLINGMKADTGNHEQARTLLHTGSFQFVRPSIGSWMLYGLGTENNELPGFITINATIPASDYGSAFLPATYQGTSINAGNIKNAIPNLSGKFTGNTQRKNLDALQQISKLQLNNDVANSELEALINSYELAFKMQTEVPKILDIQNENKIVLDNYGIGQKPTDNFGKQCLLARKFAEAGVRFIEIGIGSWDFHTDIEKNMITKCSEVDKPISALISDLKDRGMLEDTLIIWGGEFGRTPGFQDKATGRDHNHLGYSLWLCGGGVKGGIRYGSTDDFGHASLENNQMTIHDLHATILYLMGIDHTKLTYRYSGRDFRLTDVYGNIHHGVIV